MTKGKSLTLEQQELVRAELEKLIKRHGTQVAVGKLLEVSQATVSQIVRGDAPGLLIAKRIADHLGVSIDDLLGNTSPQAEPRLSSLTGWAEAEAEARRRFKFVPEGAWRAVANLRTAMPPRVLTPDWIGAIASDWARVLDGEGDETDQWNEKLNKRRSQ